MQKTYLLSKVRKDQKGRKAIKVSKVSLARKVLKGLKV